MTNMQDHKAIRKALDEVLGFMTNHREQMISRLFPDARQDTLDHWNRIYDERGIHDFWMALTSWNQNRLIEMAREHYR